jgi:hypothetical protein
LLALINPKVVSSNRSFATQSYVLSAGSDNPATVRICNVAAKTAGVAGQRSAFNVPTILAE